MGKKLALNVFYTIGIFLCAAVAYWGYQHSQYAYILAAVIIAAMFIILKIKLLKELRTPKK